MLKLFQRTNRRAASAFVRLISGTQKPMSGVKPSAYEKKVLVWTGKYKNASEIPERVDYNVIQRASSKFRIKYINYGIALTLILCGYMIYLGRKANEKGETLLQMNLDWHEQQNKDKKP